MSATLNAERFANYFSELEVKGMKIPTYKNKVPKKVFGFSSIPN